MEIPQKLVLIQILANLFEAESQKLYIRLQFEAGGQFKHQEKL